MRIHRALAASAALLGLSMTLQARPPQPGYRLVEIAPPASLLQGCLTDRQIRVASLSLNDAGLVSGLLTCQTSVDPQNQSAKNRSFLATPWFGGYELSSSEPAGQTFAGAVNNRNEAFGFEGPEMGGALYGTKWTLSGGRQRVFDDPSCGDGLRWSVAADGNARYTIGSANRGIPSLPPPFDTLCVQSRWVIQSADGVESLGPVDGAPVSLNSFHMAVGHSERSAIRYHIPTGAIRVLHAADDEHHAIASHINDLGEAAGRVMKSSMPGLFSYCDPGVAVRWDREGRERVLPHLPGAVSSRAYEVGHDGETVGDSGAGDYCGIEDQGSERAVLWKSGRAQDLNPLIAGARRVTLTSATSINRLGIIAATGFDTREPMSLCSTVSYDEETGVPTVLDVPCRNTRLYLLMPVGR